MKHYFIQFQSFCDFITSKMLSINYVHVVLFIVSVSSGNFLQNDKCVYFESESGFIKLLDAPSLKENSTISMEVKAYNCDAISIRLNNGENYNLIVSDPVLRKSFEIFSSCIGLWQEGILNNKYKQY